MSDKDNVLPISAVEFDPQNARRRTERSSNMIRESLQQFGPLRSLAGQRLPDGRIIIRAGNGTLEEAGQIGIERVRIIERKSDEIVVVVADDLDEAKWKSYAIADNRSSDLSEWDVGVLQELSADGIDVGDWFTDEEMAEWDPGIPDDHEFPTEEEDEESTADLLEQADSGAIESRVKAGQIWALGRHRIACGDSTDEANVRKLLGGQRFEMIFTDPPYGVDYEGGHFHSGDVKIKRKREKLANDGEDIYSAVIPLMAAHCDGPIYTWFADSKALPIYQAVSKVGEIHALIIWHKINATYAAMNAQYKQRHEPCLYWKPKGKTLRWVGATTEATLWEMKRDAQNTYHPTQKPVELAERAMGNHDANLIGDFFLGSGSTIIAAQKMEGDRTVYGFELSADYCEVIIRRWEQFTGMTAELAGSL